MLSVFGWTLVKVKDCTELAISLSDHNKRACEAEAKNEELRRGWRDEVSRYQETIAQLRQRVEVLDGRADFAETTVKGLTTSNGALWSQNERLLGIVAEMRRAGFEMPRFDVEPNDQVHTVEQDDAEALKGDKTLIATSDD